jgi:hypothetical protein
MTPDDKEGDDTKPTLCPSCNTNPAEPPHSCPYAEEVSRNDDPMHCTCCDECTHQCYLDS